MKLNDNPQPQDPPESDKLAGAGCMARIVVHGPIPETCPDCGCENCNDPGWECPADKCCIRDAINAGGEFADRCDQCGEELSYYDEVGRYCSSCPGQACPKCLSVIGYREADMVDNGVGMEKCGPAHCEECDWVEPTFGDDLNFLHNVERTCADD